MNANSTESKRLTRRMSEQLKGRVAIVTGAASGLGRAIAEALAAEEVTVVVNDVNEAAGQTTTEGIIAAGGDALFIPGDVSRVEDVRRLMSVTAERCRRIDILVNNAGLQHVAPITEFAEERWNYLIGVMLTGPFLTTKYAFPHMQAQKWGRIVNISSINGLVSSEFKAAYVSAKHGVIGLTKVTALEGAPHNITAVAICPSFIRTPLMENQIAAQAKFRGIPEQDVVDKVMLSGTALKRMLEPEEVAALIVYLCTDLAQGITGSAVPIDCGKTAR